MDSIVTEPLPLGYVLSGGSARLKRATALSAIYGCVATTPSAIGHGTPMESTPLKPNGIGGNAIVGSVSAFNGETRVTHGNT